MLIQLKMSEHGDSATATKPHLGVRRPILYAMVAAVAVLIVFALAMLSVSRTPDDRRVDAELAAMQQKMAEKRRQTVAGIADRIVAAPIGRRAQEELLKSTDEEVAGTNP